MVSRGIGDSSGSLSGGQGITCLQINLGRGRAATNSLLKTMEEERAEVILIQEPYVRDGKVVGLGDGTVLWRGGRTPKPR